ncbi:MAG TPA: CHAP domain-containing protein [Stellaceae bacterium]|jgi:surface antigen|nr:CHAP domain-containing protein [Stellaceae bacterium]
MRAKMGWGLVWGAILVSCFAGHSRRAAAANCALYARAVTGVDLYGAAGGWWDEAAGRYQRGPEPVVGSILVFRRTGRIPSGHVAVVSKVVGPSMVLVDHANWYRGTVSRDMPVVDTSPNHDWTRVAVMNGGSGQLGADYPTYGFVYPRSGPRQLVATVDAGGFDPYVAAGHVAFDPLQQAGLFHFAVADQYRRRAARGRRSAHGYARQAWRAHVSASYSGRAARKSPSRTASAD